MYKNLDKNYVCWVAITWLEELSDNYRAAVFVYYNTGNKEIVDVTKPTGVRGWERHRA